MNKTARKILSTTAIAGMLMAGGAAGAQAKDGVEDTTVDPVTGAAIVEDNGVHGPGHVDLNDAPDDGDTVVAPAVDPAAVPAADPALTEDEAEDAKDAEEEAEEAAEDAEDETKVEDAGIPHAEGLDDAPGAPDDGL
jgi:hypothetical protein